MAYPPIQIELENKSHFLARMAGHRAGIQVKVDKVAKALAEEIAEAAKDLVAVDSGKTKDSIRVEKRDDAWAAIADRFGDKPEVPVVLEFGSAGRPAQPFMLPAAQLVLAAGGVQAAIRTVGGLLERRI